MDKYCKNFEGGLCKKTGLDVPRSWCLDVCKGRAIRPDERTALNEKLLVKNKDLKAEQPYQELSILQMGENFVRAMGRAARMKFKTVDKQEYIERILCCTTCNQTGKCPYCGCKLGLKARLTSESGCPNPETYPNLKKYPPRNYWAVCREMTSVVIPARNEPYLNQTIENLLKTAAGKIEIVVVLDGHKQDVIKDDRVKVIYHEQAKGRRISDNEGARLAKGKYLFHIDGHCIMSEGWDTKLKCVCDDRTVVVSVIRPLTEDFEYKGNAKYTFVYINQDIHEKWWGSYKKLDKCELIEETMCFTGCGWMIQKDYWDKLGGFDESLGELCHLGPEWSLKIWLHDKYPGRLVLRTDVFCGHKFGTNKDNALYKAKVISQKMFKEKMLARYGDKIQELVKKFNPPDWETKGLETKKTKTVCIQHRTQIGNQQEYDKLVNVLPWVTCYLLYYGRYDLAQEATECFLAQTYPNKRLLIINDHPQPVKFAENHPDIEIQNLPFGTFDNLNYKYNYAFSQIKTPLFAPWDDDDIYLPWHLTSLVQAILKIPFKDIPRKTGIRFRYSWSSGHIRGFGGKMWGNCIFDTWDKNGNIFPVCDGQVTQNADRQVQSQHWEHHWLDVTVHPLSFIYRWGTGESHGSAHKGEKGLRHAKNLREKKQKVKLPEYWWPHWKSNYIQDVKDYLDNCDAVPRIKNEQRGVFRKASLGAEALKKLIPENPYDCSSWVEMAIDIKENPDNWPGLRQLWK